MDQVHIFDPLYFCLPKDVDFQMRKPCKMLYLDHIHMKDNNTTVATGEHEKTMFNNVNGMVCKSQCHLKVRKQISNNVMK